MHSQVGFSLELQNNNNDQYTVSRLIQSRSTFTLARAIFSFIVYTLEYTIVYTSALPCIVEKHLSIMLTRIYGISPCLYSHVHTLYDHCVYYI